MVLEPGVVPGATGPCEPGGVLVPLPVVAPPMPDGVLPNVPGIAPVGLSSPGAGVDCCGVGTLGRVESSGGLADGDGASPPGGVMPGAVAAPPPPRVAPPICASAGTATSMPIDVMTSIFFNDTM